MKHPILTLSLLLLVQVSVAAETIVVDSVIPGGPAIAAGVQADDHILRFDGREVTTWDELEKTLAAHRPGDTVALTVERGGEAVDLELTLGERPGGRASMGVRLAIGPDPGTAPERDAATAECLRWIDETYRIGAVTRDLSIDQRQAYEGIRACVVRDTQRMHPTTAVKACDSVFKVHCGGLELLAEIGEALVLRCEERLEESLGLKPDQYKGWKECAQHKVFDRYSKTGEPSDETACRAALLEECGENIDAAVRAGEISPEQRGFVKCCSADALGSDSHSGGGDRCQMIDDGFSRGPCRDHPVCINRLTSEWIHCSVLEGDPAVQAR